VATALLVGILTLLSMIRVWLETFWKDHPQGPLVSIERRGYAQQWLLFGAPVLILGLLTVGLGLAAEPVFDLATRAASQLADPAAYVEAVLRNVQ
jgi:multicomponent Na+:H+ antiporter subunit D